MATGKSLPSRAPKASGQAHLAGPHAWLRATHPGFTAAAATKKREVGKEGAGVRPPPQALLTRLDRPGTGVLQ